MAQSLSVVLITLNEEKNIVDCLKSATGADELIVVDSGSQDRTTELAAELGARVEKRAMTDFAGQRNYAASLATSDWILSLDADERLTPELWREIRHAMSKNDHSAYLIPELNIIFGRPLRHGGWYPQHHVRLQKRGSGDWTGHVMEKVIIADGSIGKLQEPIVHYGHPDVHTFITKLDRYSTIEAERSTPRPIAVLAILALAVPLPYFVYKYLVQAGFLDGWQGLSAAALLSIYRSLVYLKSIEMRARRPEHKA